MFIKNDYVMYGLTGVCKVADIRKESAGNQRGEEYFILHPVKDEHSKIMIPVSRGKARMRPLVTYVPEQCNDEKLKKVLKVNDFRHFFLDFIIVTYYN